MKNIIKYAITAIVVIALVAFTVLKLKKNQSEIQGKVYHNDPNLAVTIQAETVKEAAFSESTPFLGSFAPNREVNIGSEVAGKIIKVGVSEGDHVAAGSLIAQLDTEILLAQLHALQITHDNAEATLKRYEQAATGVTQLQVDNARTNVLTNEAQIDQLKKQISQYTIKAPFGGIITTRNFDLGAVVSPAQQLVTITDIGALKLEVSIPEKYITQFRNGMPMTVKTDLYPEATFSGKVDLISSKADAAHNFTVKILVSNSTKSPLKSGMYGSVMMENAQKNAISISRSALLGSSHKPQVYVVENGIAKLRDITIGTGNANNIQVINGLKTNDIVATGGIVNIENGSKVVVVNKLN